MGDEGVRPEAAGWVPRLGGGHQEVDRILDELEQIYASQPNEWLVADPIASMVMREEGYEDEDELEDALGGSWEAFLGGMPHIEVRRNARDDLEFKVLKPDPDAPPRRLTLRVDSRDDLWRVLFKAPEATILIPHLEFEIGADHKRRVDTLYNYIAAAEWNLSSHIRGRKDLAAEYVVACRAVRAHRTRAPLRRSVITRGAKKVVCGAATPAGRTTGAAQCQLATHSNKTAREPWRFCDAPPSCSP